MKRLLLLILSISLYNSTFAQYESMLNDTSRYWKVYNYRFLLGVDIFADSINLGKDSVINNVTYTELQSQYHNITFGGLSSYGFLREDTITGKLWYLNTTSNPNPIEYCVYDLNLAVNDTFVVSTDSLLVERVYFQNNRKHIKLRLFSNPKYELSYPGLSQTFVYDTLLFVEGIGSTRGFDNRVNTSDPFTGLQSSGRLLCAFQQNNQIFQHQLKPVVPFLDDCDTFDLAVQLNELELNTQAVSIFPNPTNGKLRISSSIEMERIVLYSVSGSRIREVRVDQSHPEESVIFLPQAAGIYFLRVLAKDGATYSEKIVKQ